jgi:acetylornithine deacetylase/succinyl-diaminopimelate desuccinylase-like protein
MNWDREGLEAVERLRRMLRHDTTNPPGDELPLARALADEVRDNGVDATVYESAENRGNLVVRLKGDGSERPLLLLSHLDVVPAEPDMWRFPPFAGELEEGNVWGRGAIDSKLTGAVMMQVLLMIQRANVKLKRDLVLVAAADEETGATYGVDWLLQNHPDVFDAEFGINEAGGFTAMIDGQPLYLCQVAEKGSAPVDLVAKGKPGHSSVPHDENAIVALGRSLAGLGEAKLPHHPPESVKAFFESAADAQSDERVAELLRAALIPAQSDDALASLPVEERDRLMFDAMLRNTCAPTLLNAGLKRNVIPSEARVGLSGRPLPGATEESFLAELRAAVGEDIEIDLTEPFRQGVQFDHESALFGVLTESTRTFEPDATVVPYMQTGGTDARFLADLDIHVYGYIPMRHEPGPGFFELCHGHDERVSVSNVTFAVQVLFDAVCRMNRWRRE